MITILRKVGGSTVLTVPKSALDEAGLSAGRKVDVTFENGHLVVTGIKPGRPKADWQAMLDGCDPTQPYDSEAQAWIDRSLVGLEIPRDN